MAPVIALAAAHPLITGTLVGASAVAGGAAAKKVFTKGQKQESTLDAGPDTKVSGSPELKPGQKVNMINTSYQGILDPPNSARTTLLGGIRS